MPGMIERYFSSDKAHLDSLGLQVERALFQKDPALHTHDFNETFIIISGTATYVLGERSYPVKRGDVYAVKGNTPHGFRNVCELDIISLMVKPSFFSQSAPDIRAVPGFVPFFLLEPEARALDGRASSLTLGKQALHDVTALTDILMREQEWGGPSAYPMLRMTFGALVGYIATQYEVRRQLSGALPVISNAIAFMDQNLNKPLRLNDIAQSVQLSPRQLERLFVEYHDISPMKHLRTLRLKHAVGLLAERNVSDAAHDSGFEDVSYFIRAFRHAYGVTPSAARKIIQEA